jgi:hypothetical protein
VSLQLVELMRGEIGLESKLGHGTTATFSIPFNRAQYEEGSPLIDLASIPDRLQSDVSVSCGSSGDLTPPGTPNNLDGAVKMARGRKGSPAINTNIPDHLMSLSESERKNIQILVVEDK